MKDKVIVFGSFAVDLMARAPHLPMAGQTVKGSRFQMGAGGKGFNQAVAAHKAGADVLTITKVGRDTFGQVAFDIMEENGMKKEGVIFSETEKTGIAIINVDETTSQNQIVIVPGACNTLTRGEIDKFRKELGEAKYLLLQLEVNQDANEYITNIAKESGCKVILNTAPYQKISDSFLAQIDLVTPNEVEAFEMTGIKITDFESARQSAKVFFQKGVKEVVITLGERGVFVSSNGREEMIEAYHVDTVDTTGAGDAFNGGLLTALAEGKKIFEAAKFGNALAALSVQKIGAAASMPDREEIDSFIIKNQ